MSYAVLPLTQGYCAIVDRKNLRRLKRHKWHTHFSGGRDRLKGEPYARTEIKGKKVYLHTFLKPAGEGFHTDHKNHQTLDCREENLEVISVLQNMARRRAANKLKTLMKRVRLAEIDMADLINNSFFETQFEGKPHA